MTALTAISPAEAPPPAPPPARQRPASTRRERRPATLDFLARRLLATSWAPLAAPAAGSRRWLVETCRAELLWSVADWRRATDSYAVSFDESSYDRHPSEGHRLPHERAAARLVNCHLHTDVQDWSIRKLILAIRAQRKAAADTTQSGAYRASWADAAEGSGADLRLYVARRRKAWSAFLTAAAEYRELRTATALQMAA